MFHKYLTLHRSVLGEDCKRFRLFETKYRLKSLKSKRMTILQESFTKVNTGKKTVVNNVRIFDGEKLIGPTSVVIENGLIISKDATENAAVINAEGAFMLPGLIDAHIHLHGKDNLEQLCGHGVTTAFDMSTWPQSLLDSLKAQTGLTDIRTCGVGATVEGSTHSHIPGRPKEMTLSKAADAVGFVEKRIAEGADYIKIIADIPGPDAEMLDALVRASHANSKLTVAHAVSYDAVRMVLDAHVDMITHVPLDKPLDTTAISKMLTDKSIAIPTLTMMEGVSRNKGIPFTAAHQSVTNMHSSGIPILAGTDANMAKGVPANVPHGESIHHELELLVAAGLSTVDALRAATILPAKYFGLTDRGIIAPGYRADLILIDSDPVADIRATRNIRRIWCNSAEYVRNSS